MLDYRPFNLGRKRLVSSSPLAELVARDDGAREIEAVIHADLERVLVIVEGAERHQRRRRNEAAVAEIIVLILGLHRPARREHVFGAAADGPAVAVSIAEQEGDGNAAESHALAVVGIGVAALYIDQRRS